MAVNSIAAGTGDTAVVTLASCKIKVSMTYAGDTTGQFSDIVTLAVDLTVAGSSPPAPVPGRPVTLSLGTQTCAARSDSTGRATCSVRISQHPGPVSAGASFAGDRPMRPEAPTLTSRSRRRTSRPPTPGRQPPTITTPSPPRHG